MTNRRAKIATGATVVGLAALGGVALGSNPGMPVASQQVASAGGHAVVTSTSGSATLPTSTTSPTHRTAPIVTRASGGGLAPTEDD